MADHTRPITAFCDAKYSSCHVHTNTNILPSTLHHNPTTPYPSYTQTLTTLTTLLSHLNHHRHHLLQTLSTHLPTFLPIPLPLPLSTITPCTLTHALILTLTLRPLRRYLCATEHLLHVLRGTRRTLQRSSVVAPAILWEVRQLGAAVEALIEKGEAVMSELAVWMGGEGSDIGLGVQGGGRGWRGGESDGEDERGRGQEAQRRLKCWDGPRGMCAKVAEKIKEGVEEARRRRRVREEVGRRIGLLADRVVGLRRRAERVVRR